MTKFFSSVFMQCMVEKQTPLVLQTWRAGKHTKSEYWFTE